MLARLSALCDDFYRTLAIKKKIRQQLSSCEQSPTWRACWEPTHRQMGSRGRGAGSTPTHSLSFLIGNHGSQNTDPARSEFSLLHKIYISNFFIHIFIQSQLSSTYWLKIKSKPTYTHTHTKIQMNLFTKQK